MYPYILKTGTLKRFFEKIPTMGVPAKINNHYIYMLGFKSINDRPILQILKFLRLTDEAGVPTELYKQYRDTTKSTVVLGSTIRVAYSDLYKTYPDAEQRDQQTLRNFFSANTGLGLRASMATAETFRSLCSLANFEGPREVENQSYPATRSADKVTDTHSFDYVFSEGRKARVLIPRDVSDEEIERLKKLLDACKFSANS